MVQSFLVKETEQLIYEPDQLAEWEQKCKELGLENQLDLRTPSKSPVPFESINETQQRVYKTLCPVAVDYKEYRKTTIPLEVLSLIALAVHEEYFDKIEIWYDDKTPDPIAVGFRGNGRSDPFAIARWGDVIDPFEKLKEKAKKVYKNSSLIKIKLKIADYDQKLKTLDENVEAYFDVQVEDYQVQGW